MSAQKMVPLEFALHHAKHPHPHECERLGLAAADAIPVADMREAWIRNDDAVPARLMFTEPPTAHLKERYRRVLIADHPEQT